MQTITHEFDIVLNARTQGYLYTCTALVCSVVPGSEYSKFLPASYFSFAQHPTTIEENLMDLFPIAGLKN